MIARSPAFSLVAVLSLALGIAVNTTLFSVASASLLRPLGGPGGSDLMRIGRSTHGEHQFRSLTYEEYAYLRAHASSLADVLGEQMEAVAIGGHDGSQRVAAEFVTANYFSMLQISFAVGRGFVATKDQATGDGPTVAISDGLWRRRFGANPDVVGAAVLINNVQCTIVGVAPPGFAGTFPGVEIELWLPVEVAGVIKHRPGRSEQPSMQLIGRLKRDVSIATARAELDVLARRMAEENPAREPGRGFVIEWARGIHPAFARPLSTFLLLLMAVVAVVLLIACANVANLLLARASARRGELAVRLALGASRGRVVRQLLVESLVLALLGGGAGLMLSIWPVRLLNALFSVPGPAGAPTSLNLEVDMRVLLFTAAVTMLTVLVFGLAPALQATRVDLLSALKDSPALFGRKRSRLRSALAVVQVATSFVLLVGALLLFRSLVNSETLEIGFDPDTVVVASFEDLRSFGYDAHRVERFYEELLAQARALPGVEGAALANFVGEGSGHPIALAVPGRSPTSGQEMRVPVGRVSDGYFATVQRPLIRGRDFTKRDRAGAPLVAIVNEAIVRRFWPGEDPLGKRIQLGEDLSGHEIVGVARDAGYVSFAGGVGPFVFLPAFGSGTLHVRTPQSPTRALADIKRLAHEIEPSLPPFSGRTMRDAMASSLVPARITQAVFGVAGVIALLLTSGGLYGFVCYLLEQRLKEIGIRLALGASRRDVFRVIAGSAVKLALVGVAIGVALAAATMRLLSAFLYGLSPTDPLTFGGIAALLLFVTLAAGYAGARRGLYVDPIVVLRHE